MVLGDVPGSATLIVPAVSVNRRPAGPAQVDIGVSDIGVDVGLAPGLGIERLGTESVPTPSGAALVGVGWIDSCELETGRLLQLPTSLVQATFAGTLPAALKPRVHPDVANR
jgi:hypothetical protein